MNWTDRRTCIRRQTSVSAQILIIRVLVLVLLVAPALHLAGDGQVASSPNSSVHASHLCSVPVLTPATLAVLPITAIARLPEAPVITVPWLPARPADHPPRSA
jgi:hypothetical protein